MIIDFKLADSDSEKENKLYWVGIMWKLIDEFDPKKQGTVSDDILPINEDFREWLHSNWKISLISDPKIPESIIGINIDDSSVSMLMLKYNPRDFSD